jgi:adenylate cyclase
MPQTQALSIMFADVAGSTKLFERLGDIAARELLAHALKLMEQAVVQHGGRVIKTIGDELMCTFPTTVQGLHSACDMQQRVKDDSMLKREVVALRIGLHYGETLLEDNDVFGDAVNVAARVVGLAKREQIVVTDAMLRGLTNFGQFRTRALGSTHVAGKSQPIEIIDILWQHDTANITTLTRAVRIEDPARASRLELKFRGKALEMTDLSPPFNFGRDPASTIIVEGEWVSRNHALLECRRGIFVLSDRSTNGTYVRFNGEDELRIHRDEVQLRKDGILSLGQSTGRTSDLFIQFRLV